MPDLRAIDYNGHTPLDITDTEGPFSLDQPMTDREKLLYELGRLHGLIDAVQNIAERGTQPAKAPEAA